MTPTTLFDKIWSAHEVAPGLLYIDLHLVHEVTSPQAFDGLRMAGRTVRRPELTIATEDHNVPTTDLLKPIADPVSRTQVETLRGNCADFGVPLHPLGDAEQGIVHVVGPQLGLTQPGRDPRGNLQRRARLAALDLREHRRRHSAPLR